MRTAEENLEFLRTMSTKAYPENFWDDDFGILNEFSGYSLKKIPASSGWGFNST